MIDLPLSARNTTAMHVKSIFPTFSDFYYAPYTDWKDFGVNILFFML